jgi:hypothetical protein
MNEQMTMESMAQPGLRPGGYLTLQERFDEWLATAEGREVYEAVVVRAHRVRASGRSHYSMKALWEAVRVDRDVMGGSALKLNNDYTSRMARRVMADYPDLDGFFELRETRA